MKCGIEQIKADRKEGSIRELVFLSLNEINETLDQKIPFELGDEAKLFGNEGVLDSLALVTLIVSIEAQLEMNLGISIILASEKAMSRRQSPFNTIGSLVTYVSSLVEEVKVNEVQS